MYKLFFLLLLFTFTSCAPKPWTASNDWEKLTPPAETPAHTLFLIGDVGKPSTNPLEPSLLFLSRMLTARNENNTIVFLGDNIYWFGLPEKTALFYSDAEKKLKTQLDVVKEHHARVIFIPGNHDWDGSRHKGLEYINNQEKYVEAYSSQNLFLPDSGCPGPVVIEEPNHVLVILDTQWFLHTFERGKNCPYPTNSAVFDQLRVILKKYESKQVIVMGHHPMYSNSGHGGHFTCQEHLFPLRVINHKLWIPLPLIGSLYPILRKAKKTPQDIGHPVYQNMRDSLVAIFETHPHLTYVSGHDHNLQAREKNHVNYLVSGSGCKKSPLRKRLGADFIHQAKGFMLLKQWSDGQSWLEVWEPDEEGVQGRVVFRKKIK